MRRVNASKALHGARFAFGTLTVFPARITRWDRAAARAGMTLAPLAGLAVGLCAAAAGAGCWALGSGASLAAVVATAVPAVLTRGLHLDGLADVADGLGSAKPADDALRIMKRSDIGPFGVVTLLFCLLAQVAALAHLFEQDGWARGTAAVVVSALTARTSLTLASRRGVPAARPDGLGAVVAGTVPIRRALAVAALVTAACAGAGWVFGPWPALHWALAVAAGLAVAQALLHRCVRRFGGVTGDVFGAVAEASATVTLLALALG
ncbi:adenosylcobinamide-GDP ribazoletransferase [Streptomyces sp. NPDC048416]|uniref:adenosylcobinamide-GDP ribazoletransferase n=1 Tax=Streptomyces sp. NPDC048416 TaxID=3365546 RepID=UPI00371DE6AD